MPELNMVRMEFDWRRLMELGRRRRLPMQAVDTGYLVHCQLGELFGEAAPKPFRLQSIQGNSVAVLAYTPASIAGLRERADSFADPAVHQACNWATFAAKPMPAAWKAGQRLGFEVRACPVVRLASEGRHNRKGAEVDAFVVRCWKAGEGAQVDREAVYRDWVAMQLEGRGANVLRVGLHGFQRERVVRRTQGAERRSATRERPDALLRGELQVTDPDAFATLLARGVGRHRSFGFGMLLLRPC